MLTQIQLYRADTEYDKLRKTIVDSSGVVKVVLSACHQLCNLEISHNKFMILVRGCFNEACGNAVYRRFVASASLHVVTEKLLEHNLTLKHHSIQNRHRLAIRHMNKYVSDYQQLGDRIGTFDLSYADKFQRDKPIRIPVNEYIRETQSFLETHYTTEKERRKTFESELTSYRRVEHLVGVIVTRAYDLRLARFNQLLLPYESEHIADITRLENGLPFSSFDDIAVLERLILYERHRCSGLYTMNYFCQKYKTFLADHEKFWHDEKEDSHEKKHQHTIEKYQLYRTLIKKRAGETLNNFLEKPLEKKDKCLLARESIIAIEHNERNELLFVVAANTHVHHYTLRILARLCKASYMAVYRAMDLRLKGSDLFHPEFITQWSNSSPDAVTDETRVLSKRGINCRVVAMKESLETFTKDWKSIGDQATGLPQKGAPYVKSCKLLGRLQPEMTWGNMIALWTFRLPCRHYDILYALQTRYHHIYIEFFGDKKEKATGLFKGEEVTNDCTLVFRLDDDDPYCYTLSFVVQKKAKK